MMLTIYDIMSAGAELRHDKYLDRWTLVSASGAVLRRVQARTAQGLIALLHLAPRRTDICNYYTLNNITQGALE